ncbi:hypothetical protein [Bacillus weihaiensis]|uniref:Uncharacterized protein n=1 Tax=Bacillus weihaiensis TaxID=1547283 RepID=A0A1L3MWB3_9BACI|nr:hypothetical protein [Bacillus weihaiensis]APH06618.1 hypothetical protein A9C19_19010 [Bacillus weihaiensis]
MNKFTTALDEVIKSFEKLSLEWEKIEDTHSDVLSEKYPFNEDFREVVSSLKEWKESINSKELK